MLGEVCVQEGALQLEATGIQFCSCPPGGGGEDGSNPAQIQPRGPCDSPVAPVTAPSPGNPVPRQVDGVTPGAAWRPLLSPSRRQSRRLARVPNSRFGRLMDLGVFRPQLLVAVGP